MVFGDFLSFRVGWFQRGMRPLELTFLSSRQMSLDTSFLLLSRDSASDELPQPRRVVATTPRHLPQPPSPGGRRGAAPTAARRKRVTPFLGEEDPGGAGLEVCMWLCRPERSAAPRLPAGCLLRNRPHNSTHCGRDQRREQSAGAAADSPPGQILGLRAGPLRGSRRRSSLARR